MRINELESEKKKLDNDIQRAMSQVAQLNKEKDGILKNYDTLKKTYERDVSQAQEADSFKTESWNKQPLLETKQQVGDDSHKKLAKLQKDYDIVSRERNKMKEEINQNRNTLKEFNDRITEFKKRLETAEN